MTAAYLFRVVLCTKFWSDVWITCTHISLLPLRFKPPLNALFVDDILTSSIIKLLTNDVKPSHLHSSPLPPPHLTPLSTPSLPPPDQTIVQEWARQQDTVTRDVVLMVAIPTGVVVVIVVALVVLLLKWVVTHQRESLQECPR